MSFPVRLAAQQYARARRQGPARALGLLRGDRTVDRRVYLRRRERQLSSRCCVYDNAMAQSFFARPECELIDRRSRKTYSEARMAMFTWIEGWYNPRRRHSGIGQKTPTKFEKDWQNKANATMPIAAKLTSVSELKI